MTESRALTQKTLTSAARNLILLSGCPPPFITTRRPPLLIASVLALINERPPRFNLLTMCNTARSANSRHCPDLLYTAGGSGGLLGCFLTLCHPVILPLPSPLRRLFLPFGLPLPPPPTLPVIYLFLSNYSWPF